MSKFLNPALTIISFNVGYIIIIMKMPKSIILLVLVSLVIVGIVVIWWSGSGKTFVGVSKNSCDYKFLQWCKDNPRAGDYDNFGLTDRQCIGQGSYRTCDQVMEALS